MEIRTLGKSGLRVSVVGLGCNNFGWRIDLAMSHKVVHRALDLGVTLLDTADIYGDGESEEMLGEILGDRRKELVLATKFAKPLSARTGGPFGSRTYIFSAVEDSLRRLRTDWIDLYQYHAPDPRTPMEETLLALDDLVHQGKVRYVGLSNHAAWQVVEAQWLAKHYRLNSLVSCQDEYSLLERGVERELIPAIRAHGLGLLPYYPLAAGMLSGKYKRSTAPEADTRFASKAMGELGSHYMTDANWSIVEKLNAFCRARGHTMIELAFSWLAARSTVSSVIAGATKPEQIEQNVKAVSWALTADEIAEIDKISAKV
jgi:aryl-alcohol dehydrogenase-like predicted oxidoreductase